MQACICLSHDGHPDQASNTERRPVLSPTSGGYSQVFKAAFCSVLAA